MALLVDERDAAQPGVHALLIGVGRYPRLQPGHALGAFAPAAGLAELTSPLHSVEVFADWLRTKLNVTDTPLRTLRVLGSSPARAAPWANSDPTFNNISDNIHEWFDDVDTHPGNLALFYFCGHGLRIGDVHAILAEDFGSNRHSPFDHAIEPEKFSSAMLKASARRQLYLIDACSTTVALPEDYERVQPRSVIQAVRHNNLGIVKPVYIRASEFGTAAYGVANEPSLFMSAFLAAMNGAAALKQAPARWVVKTDMLKPALDWLIQRHPSGQGQEVVYGGGFSSAVEFHELPGDPLVPVRVSCDPEEYEVFSCLRVDQVQRCGPGQSPWNVDLPLGVHDFEACESTGESLPIVHGQALTESVHPPYAMVSIPCGAKP